MREYKFRAWDRYHREMIDWEQYKGELVSNDFIEHGKGPLVIMQYTGMKDINDVDIYEGDIIKREDDTIGEVKWLDNGFKIELEIKKRYYGEEFIDVIKAELGFETHDTRWGVEIIGNIYENPGLMNR